MIHRPCDICVDPVCGGKQNCNCDSCSKRDCCPRLLGIKPTIRITRRCTQACSHCCFECSPKTTETMSLETAQQISKFCTNNNIRRGEVMGGEFFLHPQWEEVLDTLAQDLQTVRLVTNGDWAGQPETAKKVCTFLANHTQFHVGISNDRWHTNKHVAEAERLLKEADIAFRVESKEEGAEDSIVPIGRSRFDFSPRYSMFGCFCHMPERKYSLLIDEVGTIYKCGMGAWDYAEVKDYLDGGFAARFKEFNTTFYKAFVPSCTSCLRAEAIANEDRANKKVG